LAKQHDSRLSLSAIVLAGVLLAVAAAAFDDRAFAPYFSTRFALFFPLVAAFLAIGVALLRPGQRPLPVDLIDGLSAGLALWLAVTAWASPAPLLAWMGQYNRGNGALFAIAILTLFAASRRLLIGERSQVALVWTWSALLLLAACVAAFQAAGLDLHWRVTKPWMGRMTGTTGNPLNLAALALLGVWLLGWLVVRLADDRRLGKPMIAAVAIGSVAAMVCNLLAVTRASYLGLLVGLTLTAAMVAWPREGRARESGSRSGVGPRTSGQRRALIVVAAATLTLGISAFVPVPNGHGGRSLVGRASSTGTDGGALSDNDAKRVELWQVAVDGFVDRPLLGYGAGAFVIADRLHRSEQRRNDTPWNLASDPHSVLLLVASTTGTPGLVLAIALCAAIALRLGRRVWPRSIEASAGEGAEKSRDRDEASADRAAALPALAYLVASGVFLLVSPLDQTVIVPIALLTGAGVGCAAGARYSWTIPALSHRAAGTVLTWGLCLACLFAVVVTAAVGSRAYRADLAMGRFDAGTDNHGAVRAAELFRWEPFYSQRAGGYLWRNGKETGDRARIDEGEALVRRSLDQDPTGPLGYADLALLALARGEPAAVPDIVTPGLRWNPHHPILEALWAYAAFDAYSRAKDPALSQSLLDGLLRTEPASPDAWFWIGALRQAQDDSTGERAALARAQQIAPHLTVEDYQQRLTGNP